MIRLLVAVALVPACVAQESEPGDFQLPPDSCERFDPSVSFDQYASCGEGVLCPVAVGGRMLAEIYNTETWHFAYVSLDGVFTQEPATGNHINISASEAGTGTFAIHAQRCEGYDEEVFWPTQLSALPVADVRVRTSDEVYRYNPASPYVVYSTDRIGYRVWGSVIVELAPPGAGTTAPPYVVDSTVHIIGGQPATGGESALYQVTPNAYEIQRAGTFDITVVGQSFGERSFTIHAFDHVDRIEAALVKAPIKAGDRGTACFYAFAGDYEVALFDYDFSGALVYTTAIKQPHRNCLEFQALYGGTGRVTVKADGLEKTVEFPIAPAQ
jgi:hypothetical protein